MSNRNGLSASDWNLPPGCSTRDIDAQCMDDDGQHCQHCGCEGFVLTLVEGVLFDQLLCDGCAAIELKRRESEVSDKGDTDD